MQIVTHHESIVCQRIFQPYFFPLESVDVSSSSLKNRQAKSLGSRTPRRSLRLQGIESIEMPPPQTPLKSSKKRKDGAAKLKRKSSAWLETTSQEFAAETIESTPETNVANVPKIMIVSPESEGLEAPLVGDKTFSPVRNPEDVAKFDVDQDIADNEVASIVEDSPEAIANEASSEEQTVDQAMPLIADDIPESKPEEGEEIPTLANNLTFSPVPRLSTGEGSEKASNRAPSIDGNNVDARVNTSIVVIDDEMSSPGAGTGPSINNLTFSPVVQKSSEEEPSKPLDRTFSPKPSNGNDSSMFSGVKSLFNLDSPAPQLQFSFPPIMETPSSPESSPVPPREKRAKSARSGVFKKPQALGKRGLTSSKASELSAKKKTAIANVMQEQMQLKTPSKNFVTFRQQQNRLENSPQGAASILVLNKSKSSVGTLLDRMRNAFGSF